MVNKDSVSYRTERALTGCREKRAHQRERWAWKMAAKRESTSSKWRNGWCNWVGNYISKMQGIPLVGCEGSQNPLLLSGKNGYRLEEKQKRSMKMLHKWWPCFVPGFQFYTNHMKVHVFRYNHVPYRRWLMNDWTLKMRALQIRKKQLIQVERYALFVAQLLIAPNNSTG